MAKWITNQPYKQDYIAAITALGVLVKLQRNSKHNVDDKCLCAKENLQFYTNSLLYIYEMVQDMQTSSVKS